MKQACTDFPLGELCRLERGQSPTLKTEPGPYPLVVTASYRRSSPEFQFDEPLFASRLFLRLGMAMRPFTESTTRMGGLPWPTSLLLQSRAPVRR